MGILDAAVVEAEHAVEGLVDQDDDVTDCDHEEGSPVGCV